MLSILTKTDSGLIQRRPLAEITPEVVDFAKEKLRTDYTNGTIDFESSRWRLSDQEKSVICKFRYRESDVRTICTEIDFDYERLIYYIKTVTALKYGTCDLTVLRELVKYILDEFCASRGFRELVAPRGISHGRALNYFMDFVGLLPFTSKEYIVLCRRTLNIIRLKEREYRKEEKHPCALNEFRSYFIFTEELEKFWAYADEREKKLYYPLYLFWKVTTILPMRVTEFCVTPYDCIRMDGDICYLTIRRSRLKGTSAYIKKVHYYKIDKDYSKYEYEIPYSFYQLIEEYKCLTKGYMHPYDLLFSLDYLHDCGFNTKVYEDKIFDSLTLNDLVKAFYRDVLCEQRGYMVVDEETLRERYTGYDGSYEMYDDEIMLLHPKHTRHLAMINLIMRGCNPVMIKEFAGHADEAISANYYGNTANIVRCATKRLYDANKNRRSREQGFVQYQYEENPLSLLINEEEACVEMDYGRCYSERFMDGDVSACGAVDGECVRCRYFVPNKNIEYRPSEKQINAEMDYVMKMLQSPKINEKLDEFQVKAHQLESHMAGFAEFCWKELMEGDAHGQKV